jgi:hypothetical protein
MIRVKCDRCGRGMWIGEEIIRFSPLETSGKPRPPPYVCSRKGCKGVKV